VGGLHGVHAKKPPKSRAVARRFEVHSPEELETGGKEGKVGWGKKRQKIYGGKVLKKREVDKALPSHRGAAEGGLDF